MRFPIIDLNAFKHADKVNLQTNVLFASLSESTIATLVEANRYYETLPQKCIGLSGKESSYYKLKMIQLAENNDKTQFHQEARQFQADQDKLKCQKWRYHQANSLDRKDFWTSLIARVKSIDTKRKLESLQSAWLLEKFPCHPSQGLVEISKSTLTVFENYLKLAEEEFFLHKKSLNANQKIKFANYLTKVSPFFIMQPALE